MSVHIISKVPTNPLLTVLNVVYNTRKSPARRQAAIPFCARRCGSQETCGQSALQHRDADWRGSESPGTSTHGCGWVAGPQSPPTLVSPVLCFTGDAAFGIPPRPLGPHIPSHPPGRLRSPRQSDPKVTLSSSTKKPTQGYC